MTTTSNRLIVLAVCLCFTIQHSSGFSALSPPPKSPVNMDGSEFQDSSLSTSSSVPSAAPSSLASPTTSSNINNNNANHVAIILNTNARSVSADLVPIAEAIFGKEHVYVTTTEEEGRQAAVQLMLQNTTMVIPVGGDGTLSSMVNFLCDSVKEQFPFLTSEEAMKELPFVAYVPLGTGNGVGSVVGSEMMSNPQSWKIFGQKKRKLRQVEHMLQSFYDIGQQLDSNEGYLDSTEAPDVIEIPMMEVSYPDSNNKDEKDTLCFFAGVGFDSLLLQDFQRIKKWSIRTKMFTKTLSSVSGYCVALVLKTLPKCVARQEHNIAVKLTTRDPDTLWVDHRRGDVVQKVGPSSKETDNNDDRDNEDNKEGRLLYEGTTGILAAGTSPFYGGGLRLFPFARLTKDKMHLRLGRIHPLRGFFNIPQIFEGSFRDRRSNSFGCLDFVGGDFDVHVTSTRTDSETKEQVRGFPVQHSGESVGYFERFRLRVIKEPVRFVTLMEKRVVKEN